MAEAAPAVSFASGHYHFSVEGVGRGNGAPVMAKAAYRSGECLYDERTGQFHDYTGGAERVVDTFVMARDDAPAWIQHAAREARQRAWNEAERADPKANARIGTEIVVGLPHELTDAQRKELLSAFVLRIVEKHGVFADVSIHTAHDDRNIHAHILLSHRELGPDGFGEIANRRTITRKHRGQVKEMTTAGIAATPHDIKHLREQWAQDVNRAYEKVGLAIRVDHRSFEDRGIKDVPTIHLGPKAAALEARGYRTDRGDINRIIEFGNAELRRLEGEKQRQDAEIIDFRNVKAEREAPTPAAAPRTDEAEKNYSKQQGDEISAEKDRKMQTPQPNRYDELKALKEQAAPEHPAFSPETIAATSAAALDRTLAAMPEAQQTPEPLTVEAIKREDATDAKTIRRQIDDQQDLAARAEEQTELSERFLATLQRDHEAGEQLKEAELRAGQTAAQEDDITDPRRRYLQAAEHFDIRRPYASLSEIAGIEGAAFQREQEKLKREAAIERDPDKRELIDLRRQIEANDYMAITSHRLSEMSKIITGNSNSEESQRQEQRAEYFAAEALELRRQREEVQERIGEREEAREMQRIDQDIERARRFNEGRSSRSSSSAPGAAAEQDNQAEGWRPVGLEEVLQPGAHVRMDMQTGQSQVRGEANAAPQTAPEAVETHQASAAASVTGQPERLAVAPERPAEVNDLGPSVPAERAAAEPERENTDARQLESNIAANLEVTDAKAAKKAALAQARGEIEASIEQGQERGYGHSR